MKAHKGQQIIQINDALRNEVDEKLYNLDTDFSLDFGPSTKIWSKPFRENAMVVGIEVLTKFGLLRTEVVYNDFWKAIELAILKLRKKLEKQRSQYYRQQRRNGYNHYLEKIDPDDIPVLTKSINVDEMSLDEAISRMELLDHTFFVYKDIESDKTAVLYKAKDGGYGLLEIE